MKRLILSLLLFTSAFISFAQQGSQALSGVFYRVQDTTTYQAAAATRHAQGYKDIYFNDQATTKHWDVWNGSSYDHVFSFNGGSSSGGGGFTPPVQVETSSFTLSPADSAKTIVLDNVADLVIDLDDFSALTSSVQFVFYRKLASDTVYFDANGETLEAQTLGLSAGGFAYLYYNADDNEFYLAAGSSGGSGGSGTVTDVLGTTNRITSTGGTAPVIDISATFEALLSKIAQRIDQNNASTTSAQLATTLSDESGTGVVAYTTSPVFTTPNIGSATGSISGNAATVTTNANLTGHVTSTGNAAVLGSFSSANLSTALTDETGTGAAVFGTSPVFTTPNIGTATGTASGNWNLTSGGTLLGVNTITSNTANQLSYTGSYTTTANSQYFEDYNPTITLRATSSDLASILQIRGSLTANAANQELYALNINPTFNANGQSNISSGFIKMRNGSYGFLFANNGTNSFFDMSASGNSFIRSNGSTGFQFASTNALSILPAVTISGVAVTISPTHAASSGAVAMRPIALTPTYNFTGSYSGTVTDFRIAPTETSMTGVTHLGLVQESTTASNGFGLTTPTATLHVVGTTKLDGSVTLPTVGNKISIKEGSGGFMGQASLTSGTNAITVSGVTTSTRCFLTMVTPSGTTLTTTHQCVCTANTVTIQANVAAGTINTADNSTFNYLLFEPAP